METGPISDNISSLTENVKDYINLRIDLFKLVITEKISRVVSAFLIAVVFFILAMFMLLFLSLAFMFWFGEVVGPTWAGALIVTALYVIAGLIIYRKRHQIFLNPLVTQITKVLMEEDSSHE